jgi:glutathione S-transferase
MLFTYLKVEFTDHRVDFPEWPALKTSPLCEFGVLPVLDINGKRLAQTRSVLRYVCQLHHLYPLSTNTVEIYLVESVCDLIDDLRAPLMTLSFAKDEEGVMKHYDGNIATGLEMLEARLAKNTANSRFFVGNTVGMADFAVFEFLWDYFLMAQKQQAHAARVQKHATLEEFANRMRRLNPELENYLKTRPFKWL